MPQDNGEQLIRKSNTETLLGSCDGSVAEKENENYGGYAYSLQTYNDSRYKILGYGQVPLSNKITS